MPRIGVDVKSLTYTSRHSAVAEKLRYLSVTHNFTLGDILYHFVHADEKPAVFFLNHYFLPSFSWGGLSGILSLNKLYL